MKNKLITLVVFFVSISSYADKIVIEVSYDKRITLIFPAKIVDDVVGIELVKADLNENKIYLTANKPTGFPQTSLYVELSSGHYYDIELKFNNATTKTVKVFSMAEATGNLSAIGLTAQESTQSIKGTAEQTTPGNRKDVMSNKNKVNPGDKNDPLVIAEKISTLPKNVFSCCAILERKLYFRLSSLFIHDNKFYFKIDIENKSTVSYDLLSIDFNIRDKKSLLSKSAKDDGQPVSGLVGVYNDSIKTIAAKSEITRVYVFDKFTISDKKKIVVSIWENGGDREISFPIEGDQLLKAKAFNP